MSHLDLEKRPSPAAQQPQWPAIAVTVLVGAMSAWLTWPQLFPETEPSNQAARSNLYPALPSLSQRAARLRQIADPVERDKLCTPFSAYARALDRALQPDARVFLSGLLGKENGSRLRIYYFLRNYLFPRDVEISWDGKAVFHESWFAGVPNDSPDELRAKGFDLLLHMSTSSDDIQLLPLTSKGVPK